MSHTYTKLNTHIVFATWDRRPLIRDEIAGRLHGYLGGIIKDHSCVPIEINGAEDHVHILARLKPTIAPADLLEAIKASSSGWLNREFHFPTAKFRWQAGYSAFSVSESAVPSVTRYIERQKEHHRTRTFEEELREILEMAGLEPPHLPGLNAEPR